MTHWSTLTPDGSVQADLIAALPSVSSLTGGTAPHSRKLEVVKERVIGAVTPKVDVMLAQKGAKRNSAASSSRQSPCATIYGRGVGGTLAVVAVGPITGAVSQAGLSVT